MRWLAGLLIFFISIMLLSPSGVLSSLDEIDISILNRNEAEAMDENIYALEEPENSDLSIENADHLFYLPTAEYFYSSDGSVLDKMPANGIIDLTAIKIEEIVHISEAIIVEENVRSNIFTDVSESMYYYQPVLWALENNITAGLTETEFAPEAVCTRGQVVTFLWRAMGQPEPVTTTNPFVDVNSSQYYYKAVLWALENNIAVGLTATEFAPDSTVTRGQFVTFLHRMKQTPSYSVSNPFVDVLENTYYTNAVLWALENGVTAGLNATHFAPEDFCTRGQVVTFIYCVMSE